MRVDKSEKIEIHKRAMKRGESCVNRNRVMGGQLVLFYLRSVDVDEDNQAPFLHQTRISRRKESTA